ncbi:MAG: bifunctional lysylphosphatidylglycerol flippase/synthetase MprF, partial [Burkholderiales bacterium]
AILLFSAATPALAQRVALLRHFIPLPFVEASHLLSSVIGFWLLILARGLFRRLDGALHLTVAVLCSAIVFSLLKGFDYEEALILLAILSSLLASRTAFYRKAALSSQPFSAAWIATIAAIVGVSIWIGVFAFKHVEYSGALWWEFAYRADAPRFLRASVTVAALALGALVYVVLRPGGPEGAPQAPGAELIRRIVAASPRSDANLALTGDKRFLMSPGGDAFVMYQVQGRSWVALGEPVGAEAASEPLLWQYREMCDRHGGWPVFYQVRPETLPLFLDLGLTPLKLGETARVDLDTFSLADSSRKDLRYADRRAGKQGLEFEIVPAAQVPGIVAQLRAVSDEWLARRAAREKRFSVGAFDEAYIGNFDCAVVRRQGLIVGFANIWRAPAGRELSVDLMRHRTSAPPGIMDFLFIRLMLAAKAENYQWFDFGMAPLSGLDRHPLAPVWHRIGAFVFSHGEHFYNFEGLRAYKEKFDPVWSPKYLAAPSGLALPRILLDIAALIAGGTRAIVGK